jgi:hypothetical protein
VSDGPNRWLPRPRFGYVDVYAAIALLSFLVARWVPVLLFHVQCPLRATLGIPCATCGMTHAFVYLAHGEVARALAWSPAGALLAGAAWLLVVADAARLAAGRPVPAVPERWARVGVATGLAVVALSWGWVLWHGDGA